MSTKVIDKENASGVNVGNVKFAGVKGLGSSMGTPKAMGSSSLTPKVKGLSISTLKENTNTAKKRAFGVDLLNTNRQQQLQQQSISIGKTPKAVKTLNMTSVSNTPIGLCKAKTEKPASTHEENFEPVEYFIGNKYDNYDDLYDSRIFEMLENMRDAGRAQSPIRQIEENDKSCQKIMRKMNKAMKKMEKKAFAVSDNLNLFEIEELEAPTLPSILEDSF
jgi:hypothetical protein